MHAHGVLEEQAAPRPKLAHATDLAGTGALLGRSLPLGGPGGQGPACDVMQRPVPRRARGGWQAWATKRPCRKRTSHHPRYGNGAPHDTANVGTLGVENVS